MHRELITMEKRRNRSIARAVRDAIEPLESRQMLTVTQDPSSGWTVITRPSGGHYIYVDNGKDAQGNFRGSDSNDGSTPDDPIRTLAEAHTLLQNMKGQDVWILLRRGDTWNEPLGPWGFHGPSKDDPMLISYYGYYFDDFGQQTYFDQSNFPANSQDLGIDPRPIINSGLNDGLMLTSGASNLVVDGIQFFPKNTDGTGSTYDGTNSIGVTGLRAQVTGHDFLVEDCVFDGYKDDVTVGNPDTPVTNFTIRRSMILDAYNEKGTHAQGLYASGSTSNLLIEENVFDHNGWHKADATDKTVFNHDMYINTGATGTIVRGNIVTRGSLRGTLLRAGGTVTDNFYDQNAVAIQVGNTASDVERNVILEGDDLPSLASGVGIDVAFSIPSVIVKDNVVAHDASAYEYNLSGINLNGGTHLADVENNIVYDWRRALITGVSGSGNTIANNTLEDFDGVHPIVQFSGSGSATFSNNSYYEPPSKDSVAFQDGNTKESFSTWQSKHGDSGSTYGTLVPYLDPNRDMGTYNGSLLVPGTLTHRTATFTAWINAERSQTREGTSGLYNPWYQPNLDGTPSDYTAAAAIKHIKDGFSTTNVTVPTQTVNIVASDPAASEVNLDPGTFTITRSGTSAQLLAPLTVGFDLSGTATQNLDYTLSKSTITFSGVLDGSTSQSITINVNPLSDSLVEGDETVKIALRNGTNSIPAYQIGNSPNATVTISDFVSTVNVQASTSEAFVQDAVPGVFTLTRSGPTDSAMTVTVLFSGAAVNPLLATADTPADYTVSGLATTYLSPDPSNGDIQDAYATVTFPVGASSVDVDITPIDTGILHGIDPDTGDPAPGDQDVGMTLIAGSGYVSGVSSGATVTIFDPDAPGSDGGDGGGTGGGGTGGDTNPPPLGHGLYEAYVNNQDNFIPAGDFSKITPPDTTPPTSDEFFNMIKAGDYGTVSFDQVDSRPGFDFSGSPGHPGTVADHFTTLWTGQLQPQYGEVYNLSLNVDGDASARIWIQNDAGNWKLIASTNDTDMTQTNYSSSNYYTHRIADANDDGVIDTSDFIAMAQNFGASGQTYKTGDFNGDGIVNALDFSTLASNFGSSDPRPSKHTISGTVDFFEAGQRYNVVVEYSDKVGRASIRMLWQSPSRTLQEVPLDRLYASSVATAPLPDGALSAVSPSLFSSTPVDGKSMDSVLG